MMSISMLKGEIMLFKLSNGKSLGFFAILIIGIVLPNINALAVSKNGFDLTNATISQQHIFCGGPAKDGIPAILEPRLITAISASYLKPDDRVIGVELDDISSAYPISILNWHEIVNDKINQHSFAVTYCPLCGTGIAFYSKLGGMDAQFGVSGLLYNSDVPLYDRETESLWSQILGEAISGELVGQKLRAIPISHTTWRDWLNQHPDTMVLSDDTGFSRDYSRNPYQGYEKFRSLYFQVNNKALDTYHPKEQVVGVELEGVFKAYPFVELEKQGLAKFEDTVKGIPITIVWDSVNRSVKLYDKNNERIAGVQGFWFAWFTFHPDTLVFKGG
jgi:hypothetical protein